MTTARHRDDICLFVSSTSSRLDIVRQVTRSFDVCWTDCPFEKFVGLNPVVDQAPVHGFHPIYAPVSDWRAEFLEQLLQLPAQFEHVLLFLDDFLILSPVDTERLQMLLDEALRRDIEYLRLVPIRRAALPRVVRRIRRGSLPEIEPIGIRSPYYSSLQAALWKRSHLEQMLKRARKSVWDFEHQAIPGHPHFAITKEPPIRYRHLIEKGKWEPHSRTSFRDLNLSFDPGAREESGRRAALALRWNGLKFEVIGYSAMRLKRYCRQIWSRSQSA